jgi:L-2-hydroxyglutarate oxidase LhgO
MTSPAPYPFDTVIIGAGVVGLAVAEALAAKNRRIVILEKNSAFGQETSSRNSEVIHAGIYYRKDFLKSRLCVTGNRMLFAWCEQKSIPHRRIGKLIVAATTEECDDLERIKALAEDNGVEGLTLLGKAQARTLEPAVAALAALFSSTTGIIDTHGLMRSLLFSAEEKGAVMACRAEVTAIHFSGAVYDLEINGGEYRIRTKILINSAGLYADHIAALTGIDIDARGYRLKPCKGNYFAASPAPKLNHLVYPVPVKNNVGLGIHATLDLAGRVRFGPDSRYPKSSP